MPYKGGVQLLPESARRPTFASYTSGNSYFYTALVIGAVILVSITVLASYKASLIQQINEKRLAILAGENGRNLEQEKTLIVASKQLKAMDQLLKSKIYLSQALGRIDQMMQSSVQLIDVDAKLDKGSIAFRAFADSYASVARQLAAFSNATGVKDITVGTIESKSHGRVEFSGELLIDKEYMLMKARPSPTPKSTP